MVNKSRLLVRFRKTRMRPCKKRRNCWKQSFKHCSSQQFPKTINKRSRWFYLPLSKLLSFIFNRLARIGSTLHAVNFTRIHVLFAARDQTEAAMISIIDTVEIALAPRSRDSCFPAEPQLVLFSHRPPGLAIFSGYFPREELSHLGKKFSTLNLVNETPLSIIRRAGSNRDLLRSTSTMINPFVKETEVADVVADCFSSKYERLDPNALDE